MTSHQKTRSENDFNFHFPSPEGGTNENLAATRALIDRQKAIFRDRERQTRKVDSVLDEWKRTVMDKVGERNWKKFMEFSNKQRQENYGLRNITHTPDGLAKLAEAKRTARKKSSPLLEKAGLKPGDLKSIHRKFSKKIDRLIQPKEPRIKLLNIVPDDKVPSEIRENRTNPWSSRKPPYDNWSWYYAWHRWGGSDPSLVNYLNYLSGSVGHRSNYGNFNAGDWDGLRLEFDTNVGIWHWAPTAGRVEMWIKARCVSAYYRVWLDDEWGWSDSDTWQRSYITANVGPSIVDEDRTQVWWAHTWGSPDSTAYGGNVIAPNSVLWFHLITTDPIPGNAWSNIKIGTYDWHFSLINDVEVDTTMRNWWYYEYLLYRVI